MSEAKSSHTRFAAVFAGGTMFSRVLGLVRDVVWVVIPLASREAFIIAFRFPNMLRDLVGEGATNAAFVPVLAETLEHDGDAGFRELTSALLSAMLVLLLVLTGVGLLALPFILEGGLSLLSPITGESAKPPDQVALLTALTLWTFPYIFFIGMTVFLMAPLFVKGHYGTPSWAPALLNVAFIVACLFFRDSFSDPAYALVLGVWLGGIAQLAVQYIALGRVTGVWLPNFKLRHPGVRTAFVLLVPVAIGQSAGEVNKLVDLMFAASLPEGSVNALFYANRLVQLPLAVFGVATAVAILPGISRSAARGDHAEFRATLVAGFRQSCFLVTPAMFGVLALAAPITRLLFEYGENTPVETERTAVAIMYSGAGLLSFAWVKVAVQGFYAFKDTRTPVAAAATSMLLNIVLNFALVGPLGFRGLALSTTIAYTVNFFVLYAFLARRHGALVTGELVSVLARIAAASIAMALAARWIHDLLAYVFGTDTLTARSLAVLPAIMVAAVVYCALARALRLEDLHEFLRVLKRR